MYGNTAHEWGEGSSARRASQRIIIRSLYIFYFSVFARRVKQASRSSSSLADLNYYPEGGEDWYRADADDRNAPSEGSDVLSYERIGFFFVFSLFRFL